MYSQRKGNKRRRLDPDAISNLAVALRNAPMGRKKSGVPASWKGRKSDYYWMNAESRFRNSAQRYRRYPKRTNFSRTKYGLTWDSASPAQKQRRVKNVMYGKGLYMRGSGGFFGDLWGARSKIFDAGHAAASAMGYGHISKPLRQALKASGIGAYDVSTNDLINGGSQTSFAAPTFTPVSDTGEVLMSNREYISNVYGPDSAGFSQQSFDLNPGLEATFPFLAQIAANYAEYEFKQLIFSYKSTVSDFQTTNGIAGQVLTATQYNTDEDQFRDKQSMMVYHGAASCKSTGNIMAGVECDPKKLSGTPGKYVRHQGLPRGEDQKEYDLGRFTIATVDFPTQLQNQAIGELWVSYTVVLRRPKLVVSRGLAISQDLLGCSPAGGAIDCPGTALVASPGVGNVCIPWSANPAELIAASGNNIGVQLSLGSTIDNGAFLTGSPNYPNLGMMGSPKALNWPGITGGRTTELKILFPADYSGDVRITYRAAGVESNSQAEFCSASARSQGEIKAIPDMLIGFNQGGAYGSPTSIVVEEQKDQSTCILGSGTEVTTLKGTVDGTAYLMQVELHVRVQQARGGIDNVVYLQLMNVKAGGAPITIQNAQMEVAEYNSGYTRKGTGLIDWEIPSTQDGRALPAPSIQLA